MRRRQRMITWDTCERRELLSGITVPQTDQATVVNYLLDPSGKPSAHQMRKLPFNASFTGPFTVGKGRYATEANQIYIRGIGTSNQFLHGDVQLRLITPTDPSIPPAGGLTTFDKNINSNSTLGLLLQADPTSIDRAGRPTRLNIYSLDPNVSSGSYVEGQATGTVAIHYSPKSNNKPGLLSSGMATIKIKAEVYTIGTTFILTNAPLYSRGH